MSNDTGGQSEAFTTELIGLCRYFGVFERDAV